MNSVQRVSSLPVRRCLVGSLRRSLPAPMVDTTQSRRHGCAHIAPARSNESFFIDAIPEEFEQVVQLNIPSEWATMGLKKLFAEKRGSEIVAIAASKKLLAEERLRQGLKNFSVPLEGIVRENYRERPSRFRPICPVIQEET